MWVRQLDWIEPIAAARRLARFNTRRDDPDPPAWHGQFFTGMPAPAGAGMPVKK